MTIQTNKRNTFVVLLLAALLSFAIAIAATAQEDQEPAEEPTEVEPDGEWKTMKTSKHYEAFALFPHTIAGGIGFHYFPGLDLSGPGSKPVSGEIPEEAEFEYVLFSSLDSSMLAGSYLELSYGYRFHRYFNLQATAGYAGRNNGANEDVGEFTSEVKYNYMGIHVALIPQARFPVSKLDFAIGLGPQVAYTIMRFQYRGSTETKVGEETDKDGYKGDYEEQGFVFGGTAQAGVEYRIKDNWGISIMYRYAYIPGKFEDSDIDHGGHFGQLSSDFHF